MNVSEEYSTLHNPPHHHVSFSSKKSSCGVDEYLTLQLNTMSKNWHEPSLDLINFFNKHILNTIYILFNSKKFIRWVNIWRSSSSPYISFNSKKFTRWVNIWRSSSSPYISFNSKLGLLPTISQRQKFDLCYCKLSACRVLSSLWYFRFWNVS